VSANVVSQHDHVALRGIALEEANEDLGAGIVDHTREHGLLSPAFEPVMFGAVHLHHLAGAVLALSPLAVGGLPLPRSPQLFLDHPLAHSLAAEHDAIVLRELLGGEGGAEVTPLLPL
jgi:hypothetical protein